MPKLFCVSDIHGFWYEFKEAIDKAGFDPNNTEHYLIVLGDCIDRGGYPNEVVRYLRRLPRKIIIKGNHESLFEECCQRGYALGHDFSNGTFESICELGDAGEGYSFDECCDRAASKMHLFLDSMADYLETKNYIFVHSWIPVINKDGLPAYYTKNRTFEFNPNWRNASKKDWEDAKWGNPFDMAVRGLKPEKTVVFGHWSTEHQWAKDEGRKDFDVNAHFDIYYGDGFIGIDATTAFSHKVNVLIIEGEEIYDQNER